MHRGLCGHSIHPYCGDGMSTCVPLQVHQTVQRQQLTCPNCVSYPSILAHPLRGVPKKDEHGIDIPVIPEPIFNGDEDASCALISDSNPSEVIARALDQVIDLDMQRLLLTYLLTVTVVAFLVTMASVVTTSDMCSQREFALANLTNATCMMDRGSHVLATSNCQFIGCGRCHEVVSDVCSWRWWHGFRFLRDIICSGTGDG